MLGVDYASVDENKPPDFKAAYDYGVRFVVVRGAYTLKGHAQPDSSVARDRAAIRDAGLQFGSYMILGWNVDPTEQVATFVNTYGAAQPGDLPVSLDIEFPNGRDATGLTTRQAVDRIETAVTALQASYPTVMIYTSARVWHEDLDNPASQVCARCPGWFKVAYPWKAQQAPHPENVPAMVLPTAWRATGSAGAYIEQFQGDALRVPGFSSTVDLNVFRNYVGGTADPRTPWAAAQLTAFGHACDPTDATSVADAIRAFQRDAKLDPDGIVGPRTWAALCAAPPAAAQQDG